MDFLNAFKSSAFLQQRDYAMPDFSKMTEPILKGEEITFYVYRKHHNKPPCHDRATLTKAGKVEDVKYTRIDMM